MPAVPQPLTGISLAIFNYVYPPSQAPCAGNCVVQWDNGVYRYVSGNCGDCVCPQGQQAVDTPLAEWLALTGIDNTQPITFQCQPQGTNGNILPAPIIQTMSVQSDIWKLVSGILGVLSLILGGVIAYLLRKS